MIEKYKTISKEAQGQIEEKKSRFIANIFYVDTIETVENVIKELKKNYFDARHNCYAYRIVEMDHIREKSSDDGEPSGTAGAPIMNILKKHELLNVLVVVTRYFGGTLLGTGGLIRAYSDATIDALAKTEIVIQEQGEKLSITISYKDLEKMKYYCTKNDIEIDQIIYEKEIQCILKVNKEQKQIIIGEQKEVEILDNYVLSECYIRKRIEK